MDSSMSRLAAPGLVVACAFALSGCKPAPVTEANFVAPMVDVAPVLFEKIIRWEIFNGQIAAVNAVDIRPRVTGHIVRVAFKEGSLVTKGDLLFVVDPRPYQTVLDSARAQLDRVRATRRLARQQDERAKALVVERAMSREEAEERASAFAQAVAEVKAAEAAVKAAELNLEFTEVRAPVAGRTSRAAITVGNMAVADQTVLTSVVSQDPVYVYFNPDELEYIRIKSAMLETSATLAQEPVVRVGLSSDGSFPYEARIDLIDNRVDSSTGTIRMRAVVPNDKDALTPGMFARVKVGFTASSPVALVSDRAIQTDQDRKFVYVVDKENKAVRQYVDVGSLASGLRVIDQGLSKSDLVVVAGAQKIYAPDMQVEPHRVTISAQPSVDLSNHSHSLGR